VTVRPAREEPTATRRTFSRAPAAFSTAPTGVPMRTRKFRVYATPSPAAVTTVSVCGLPRRTASESAAHACAPIHAPRFLPPQSLRISRIRAG